MINIFLRTYLSKMKIKCYINILFVVFFIEFRNGDWGLGIGDWGLGIGDWV